MIPAGGVYVVVPEKDNTVPLSFPSNPPRLFPSSDPPASCSSMPVIPADCDGIPERKEEMTFRLRTVARDRCCVITG
ncbi:hypothetical protein HK104_005925, partial [Borealophlyctis nickersoniae]